MHRCRNRYLRCSTCSTSQPSVSPFDFSTAAYCESLLLLRDCFRLRAFADKFRDRSDLDARPRTRTASFETLRSVTEFPYPLGAPPRFGPLPFLTAAVIICIGRISRSRLAKSTARSSLKLVSTSLAGEPSTSAVSTAIPLPRASTRYFSPPPSSSRIHSIRPWALAGHGPRPGKIFARSSRGIGDSARCRSAIDSVLEICRDRNEEERKREGQIKRGIQRRMANVSGQHLLA